jgi:hypothetical protein
MLSTVGRFFCTKYWGILHVEHCGKIYLHKLLGNTLCWTLWEDLFTQSTFVLWILYVEYCGKIYWHKIPGNTLCCTLWEDLFTQSTMNTIMLNTVGRFVYNKYWGILYVEYCGKVYLHKILENTSCWIVWEGLFTQNTGAYFMLNTVGRFIYTK